MIESLLATALSYYSVGPTPSQYRLARQAYVEAMQQVIRVNNMVTLDSTTLPGPPNPPIPMSSERAKRKFKLGDDL